MAEPLDLLHPVPFDGTIARQLTMPPITLDLVNRIDRARKGRNDRAELAAIVAAATGCPERLIRGLADDDLVRAAEWAGQALSDAEALFRR